MLIEKSEFLRDPMVVAKEIILGAKLCSRVGGKLTSGRVVEVELYKGAGDKACHACRGKTKRNAMMFEAGGIAYVYFVYGMHNMMNVVISQKDAANAVLIRALEPIDGVDVMKRRRRVEGLKSLCNGPAKLTQALGITTKHNGADLRGDVVWLERGEKCSSLAGKRIGVDYAGKDADLPWRFVIKNNPFISRPID
ncbi:MAG: DNA-3-methyladenine glycosylase [Rickettsiales bacterium]|jgi:DNA-3-methyladenine glycosylase|nr:DNA-3-methyladenine glycosylase [Rickettsiales bacterium]